ncbi:MAG: hypothetical protein MPF33_05040 [Candidatus Aramenus sp.]|jgi:tRNA threonylcarbamoyladenosine modification (KEOPS) complex  Pcc1 subunit|nr:hypothetical protein [Candidatus Aramenus sp.]
MFHVEIEISGLDDKTKSIIFNTVKVEEMDRKYVRIEEDPFKITISAERLSRGRAIMNSYIFWLYTILRIVEEVK